MPNKQKENKRHTFLQSLAKINLKIKDIKSLFTEFKKTIQKKGN